MLGLHSPPRSLTDITSPPSYTISGFWRCISPFSQYNPSTSLQSSCRSVSQSIFPPFILGSDVLWWLIQYCVLLISQAAHLQQTSLLHSSHLTKRQILPLQNHDFSSLIIGFSSFCCSFHTWSSSGLVVYWSFYIWPIHQSPFVTSFHFQLIFTWFGVSKHSNECCIITWSSLFLFKSYEKIAVLFFLKNSVHLHLEAKSCFRKPHHRDKMFSLDLILIFKWLSTLTNNTTATHFLTYHMLISSLF